VADALMIGSSVALAGQLSKLQTTHASFLGLLGAYALTYVIYTK
jgi:hypothetical protein